jgi:hypothetical protein
VYICINVNVIRWIFFSMCRSVLLIMCVYVCISRRYYSAPYTYTMLTPLSSFDAQKHVLYTDIAIGVSSSLRTNKGMLQGFHSFKKHFTILYFHINYLILMGWENLDKIYCRPLIDETTPKSVQEHNNGPHCMTTLNILKKKKK